MVKIVGDPNTWRPLVVCPVDDADADDDDDGDGGDDDVLYQLGIPAVGCIILLVDCYFTRGNLYTVRLDCQMHHPRSILL